MTAPVVIGDATLYCGDCLEILPTLPKVDAVVTDPPYGVAYDPSKKRGGGKMFAGMKMQDQIHEPIAGDDAPFDPAPILQFCENAIIWGANHFASRLPDSACWLVWDKRCGMASDDFADCELAWCSTGKPARIHRQLWKGICRGGSGNIAIAGAKQHPNQKPLELMARCLQFFPDAKRICDPYMGSGTTGVVCAQLGLEFIGIELDERHFEVACKRIEAAYAQGRLFEEPQAAPEQKNLLGDAA